MLHYTYTATGQKISQQLDDGGRLGTRREYAGPFVYVNNTLGWINTTYGRIVALPRGGFHKELHLRDHLGNTRMVLEEIDSKYEVVQEAAYYPFGLAIPTQSFALPNENDTYQNRYLYNGKEYQDDFGLNWYDYGARFYDAQIGRWHSVDPLAENAYSWTPYRYGFNNPLRYIDPDGRFELDEQTERDYPELAKFLQNMLNEWQNKSEEFQNAFYETSGLNEEQVTEMLTYGSGPKIEVGNLDRVDENGNLLGRSQGQTSLLRDQNTGELSNANEGKGLILLDKNLTVSYLENANTPFEKRSASVLVESTVYHEGTHYGNAKVNRNAHGRFGESGKEFERRAYGVDISVNIFRQYTRMQDRKALPPIQPLKPLPAYVK